MSDRFKHRAGTTAQWAASTMPLLANEIGIEHTVAGGNVVKIGDGASLWAALSPMQKVDVNGNILGNVNLRSSTQAALQALTGGATEIAVASDTGNLVRVDGSGDTFYPGTAWAQLGLGADPTTGTSTLSGGVAISPVTASPVVPGSQSTIIGANESRLGGNGTELGGITIIGANNMVWQPEASCIGVSNVVTNKGSMVFGTYNFYGELFPSCFSFVAQTTASASVASSTGFNKLGATTTGTTPAVLTIDSKAPTLPMPIPPAPTFGSNIAGGGVLAAGTYGVQLFLENDYGTSWSADTGTVTIAAGGRFVVNRPADVSRATYWGVYIGATGGNRYYYSKIGIAAATLTCGASALVTTNSLVYGGSIGSNQLQLQSGAAFACIVNLIFKIMVRDATTEYVSVFMRQVVVAEDSAGTLTMKTGAGGNTIGTDYLGISPLVAAALAFSIDDTNKLVKLTVTPTAGTTNALTWHAAVEHDVVYM